MIIAVVGFVLSGVVNATAQKSKLEDSINQTNSIHSSLNSTNIKLEPDDKQIVITWLEANETEADNTPVINITSQEFWKTFSPLLKISANNTINTVE